MVMRGRMPGRARASRVLPAPGGPIIKHVVPAGRRHFQGALDVLLAFDLAEIGLGDHSAGLRL